ncbi:MAG: hypothetical protein OEU26_12060 [Candidatus Tectomicrobia bacterium]|nr:hypothetical protein [Candidatus Tectomicrobia bacterium]
MSKTIELPDDVYTQLEYQARLRGLTLPHIIAELVEEDEKVRMTVAIERMRLKGLLLTLSVSASPAPADFEPVAVQGKPLSEVIIEERR